MLNIPKDIYFLYAHYLYFLHNLQRNVLFLYSLFPKVCLYSYLWQDMKNNQISLWPFISTLSLSAHNEPQIIETDYSFHHSSVTKSPGKRNNTPGKKKKGGNESLLKGHIYILRISSLFDEISYNEWIGNFIRLLFQERMMKRK